MTDQFQEDSCAWGGVEGAPKLEDPGEDCPALVREHAVRPRNFGDMSPGLADGYALLDDPSCGDKIELWLMIEEGRVFEIRFKSNGCASTIAVNSMLTELARGKTVAEAKKLGNADIEAAFEGGIELKTGCPLAGIKALQMAIADYEKK
jgi:nitrogen fixation protein NifU and related proteins